ncbi:MAG: YbgC/FadM family acyl-CoA thioesterase [Alphaproteobacteria bacterium]|nr:YbgC/FadM family acyl-CoA thioesterase [Alphaproteobacteria bacterium]
MLDQVHSFPVQVYYEDTDFTGVVYHANYLKYFERAREHLLGVEALVKLYEEQGVGFVVYKAELRFKEGMRFGDRLEVRTRVTVPSEYRAVFDQSIWRDGQGPKVEGRVELCCVNREGRLVPLPDLRKPRHEGSVG